MRVKANGGGGAKAVYGEFYNNASGQQQITLGFQPTQLVVYSKNRTASYRVELIYDADLSTTTQYRTYYASNTNGRDTPGFRNASNDNTIYSIDANGFTYNCANAAWAGDMCYLAYAE